MNVEGIDVVIVVGINVVLGFSFDVTEVEISEVLTAPNPVVDVLALTLVLLLLLLLSGSEVTIEEPACGVLFDKVFEFVDDAELEVRLEVFMSACVGRKVEPPLVVHQSSCTPRSRSCIEVVRVKSYISDS